MIINVHKPNMEFVATEAARIRAQNVDSGAEDRDLNFYTWKTGDNILRLLPPWSAKGFVFRKVCTHFEIPPERSVVKCLMTWPDKFDDCSLCSAIDKVQALFPSSDLGRQRYNVHYYCNVIDREDEGEGVQICRMTPSMYNWVQLQMDDPKIRDLTDYESSFDLKITKTVKRSKGRDNIRYSCSFVPERCPLHEKDNVAVMWLSSLYDLDRVFGPPDDEQLSEMHGVASRMITYYQRACREGPVPGISVVDPDDPLLGEAEASTGGSEPSRPQQGTTAAASDSEATGEVAEHLSELDPQELPPCHASLDKPAAHSNGSHGYQADLEKCILCPYEVACMHAKVTKGL